MAEITLSPDQIDFFKTLAGTPILCRPEPTEDNPRPKFEEWYYLKYWFRKIREEQVVSHYTFIKVGTPGTPTYRTHWVMEFVTMEKLEPHVVKALRAVREGNPEFPYKLSRQPLRDDTTKN